MSKKAIFALFIFAALIFGLSLRGIGENPNQATLNSLRWTEDGPFELSPERGRFALTASLVEDNTPHFSLPLAKFSLPDLGYREGKFVSLFAPGTSFLVIPGYILGRALGSSQLGVYTVITLFALANIFLIRSLAIHFGAQPLAASIGAFIFAFASPAFAYAVSFYQHHISTFFVLASVWLLLRSNRTWSLLLVWFFYAVSITVDYPNLILLAPIGIWAIQRAFSLQLTDERLAFRVNLSGFLALYGATLPLFLFAAFNQLSYGNPFQLSSTLQQVEALDSQGHPTAVAASTVLADEALNSPGQQASAIRFFNTRNMLNGFYVHLLSPGRGVVFFSPVILLGILVAIYLYREKPKTTSLLLGLIGVNFLLYSMWGDPWGGWAFGSRYLIPSYAILAIFVALGLSRWQKRRWLILVVFSLTVYSISVNSLGALTSNRLPPRVEVAALEALSGKREKYTFERNFDYLLAGGSKSFIYQAVAKNYLRPIDYYFVISSLIIFSTVLMFWRLYRLPQKEAG